MTESPTNRGNVDQDFSIHQDIVKLKSKEQSGKTASKGCITLLLMKI